MKNQSYDSKEIIKKITKNDYTLEEILGNSNMIQSDIKTKFGKLTSFFCTDEVVSKLLFYSLNYKGNIHDFEHLSHNSCEILSLIKNPSLLDKLTTEVEDVSSDEKEEDEESEEYEESDSAQYEDEEDDIKDIVEYSNVDSHALEKKISYTSPNKSASKKFSKKFTILDDTFSSLQEGDRSSNTKKRSCFPFLDKLFDYLVGKHKLLRTFLLHKHSQDKLESMDIEENSKYLEHISQEPIIDDLLSGYFTRIFINIAQQRRSRVSIIK